MESPLLIGPLIEFRRPDHRPQEKTADEAQDKNFHMVRSPQYSNDASIDQSIAGGPICAWIRKEQRIVGHSQSNGLEIEAGAETVVRVGGART
jgi:hypothetical protein